MTFANGLHSKTEKLSTMADFILAVTPIDSSLWAVYDGWDGYWIEAEEGDNGDWDWIAKERHETPLKTY